MLTVSKSGRSYIPGKPLSSDLRHIIIDKIIDAGGNPLTMIFPGRFVYLVSVEHASVLGREPLLPFSSPEPVVSWSRGRETRVGYKLSRVALGTRMLCSRLSHVFYSVNTRIYGRRSEFKDSYSDAFSSFV